LVQLGCDGIEVILRDVAQVGRLGQVASDQAIDVLDWVFLPGVIWVAEEEGGDVALFGRAGVVGV